MTAEDEIILKMTFKDTVRACPYSGSYDVKRNGLITFKKNLSVPCEANGEVLVQLTEDDSPQKD